MPDLLANFAYHLPPQLIASCPASPRDHSRLLVLNRQTGQLSHHYFSDLGQFLTPNDVLIFNQSKVFPARLLGHKTTGGHVEILLLRQLTSTDWLIISRPGVKPGHTLVFSRDLTAQVLTQTPDKTLVLRFSQANLAFFHSLDKIGQTPVPPYIHSLLPERLLRQKYQTVYASVLGSAAAPTAGLHFTNRLLTSLRRKGIQTEFITLHVGLGTFQNLRPENLLTNKLHLEYYEIDQPTTARLLEAKRQGKRLIAVGTTSVRALETSPDLQAGWQTTDLFIHPPHHFNHVASLITNFHLPQSSLLMLVAAFCSAPNTPHSFTNFQTSSLGQAYQAAIANRYRFFSFGDAMWII